jgi:CRP-like cAMP-binding protein
MDTLQLLKQVPLFKNISEPVLKLVAAAAEERTFSAGETIVSEGQAPGALLIVLRGQVRAFREGEATPIVLGPGDSIGEVALLDGGTIGLTMVAVERADLVALRLERLKELAANHEAAHEFFRNVAGRLAVRLRAVANAYTLALESARRH